MKKFKKLELHKELLTNDELKQLKGGDKNINKVSSCSCTFYDAPSYTNKNTVGGCSCTCVGY
ncbi:hypothetical protein [Dysgonomonas sp. ZJ279]|uniref:hypothetical protein n=1 Tax=Dysgonomonas sp. ZJ279 TaxID=2709796 RepID=UPI0013EC4573|nr:hypothetical protein [Dysgonomonas sp. ZJ279]